MTKIKLAKIGKKILSITRDSLPWILSNQRTLATLVLTIAAAIITPSVADAVQNGGETTTESLS